jgi:hypothetical protein
MGEGKRQGGYGRVERKGKQEENYEEEVGREGRGTDE